MHTLTQEQLDKPLLKPLTLAEQKVLELTCQGLSTDQIAKELFVTAGTVKTHLKSIYYTMGISAPGTMNRYCRSMAMLKAFRFRLVKLPEVVPPDFKIYLDPPPTEE